VAGVKNLPLAGLLLALGGCGGEAGPALAAGVARPERILPANAAWVDALSLMVGPERVVALPGEAFGYSRLTPSEAGWAALPRLAVFEAERALALRPDLVLAHAWQNPETIATLRRAGIPVLAPHVPQRWADVTDGLVTLGAALGEEELAREVVLELEARRATLRTRAARFAGLSALTYTNLGAGGWTAGAGTTGDVLLELAGLENAAARAGLRGDAPADGERLLALAPDLFVVGQPDASEHSPPSAEFLLAEPALVHLEAVRARRIVTLPPALFTSASPELLTGAERLIDELERLERTGGPLRR